MTDQKESAGVADTSNPRTRVAVGRRFGDAEISRILETAAELQQRSHSRADGPGGLTLDELRQVASEAGIDPRFVDLAVSDVDAPIERQQHSMVGGTFAWRFQADVEGSISDHDRSRILQVIRDAMGQKGDLDHVFGRMEWSGDDGLGPIIIGLATGEGKTRIDLSANRGSEAGLIYGLGIPFGAIGGGAALAGLLGLSGPGAVLPLIGAMAGVSYLAGRLLWKARAAYWERRLRKVMERISSIVQEVAALPPGDEPS